MSKCYTYTFKFVYLKVMYCCVISLRYSSPLFQFNVVLYRVQFRVWPIFSVFWAGKNMADSDVSWDRMGRQPHPCIWQPCTVWIWHHCTVIDGKCFAIIFSFFLLHNLYCILCRRETKGKFQVSTIGKCM